MPLARAQFKVSSSTMIIINSMKQAASFIFLFVSLWDLSLAASPSPVVCNSSGTCTITNYLGLWPDKSTCRASQVVYPRTEEELLSAVAHGTRFNLKMKAISKWSQSIPKLVCPGGDSGLLISTRDLNSRISIHEPSMTVTTDAGVLLRDLLDTISASGFALSGATQWDSVSVAGAISTGAHGSSLQGRGSALHDFVAGISLVVPASSEEGFAKILRLTPENETLFNAARVSLGVLGAISSVTFEIEPMFKRSMELELQSDDDIEERVLEFGQESEFGDIAWHPGLRKALFKRDHRVLADTPGQGVNRYSGFQPMQRSIVEYFRITETRINKKRDVESQCRLAERIVSNKVPSGSGYLNDGENFTGFPVVGFNNVMQTSGGCQNSKPSLHMVSSDPILNPHTGLTIDPEETSLVDSEVCNWDPRVNGALYHQVAFSVELSKVKQVISDIKKLREEVGASGFCGLSIYGGIYLRYVSESRAFLGQREAGVEFDITFYRAAEGEAAAETRLNSEVVEEIEQMALFKYGVKPHWGKNRNLMFAASMQERVRNLDGFLEAKQELDPKGLFSSEWSEAILGKASVIVDSDGCGLEGLCICSEDRHCAPEHNYFCRAGRVFQSARICRYEL